MDSFAPITVSAPSKVILHGEHAVVYGKLALAASLDLRTRISFQPASKEGDIIKVLFPDIGVGRSWRVADVQKNLFVDRDHVAGATDSESNKEIDSHLLDRIRTFLDKGEENNALVVASLTCFFYLYAVVLSDAVGMSLVVESEIPIGVGLGSSAALSVCLAAGLLYIREQSLQTDLNKVCAFAYLSEKLLHGRPSGVDNSISTFGGFISFSNGKVSVLDQLPNLRILLVNTNVSRSTKEVVDDVGECMERDPLVLVPVMDAIDGVAKTCESVLREMFANGDSQERYIDLERLIDYNQKLLETLGVSHPALEDIVKVCASFDLHAKLTGAGRGGFALVLLPPYTSEKTVLAAKEDLLAKGYSCWESRLGVAGVQVRHDNKSS